MILIGNKDGVTHSLNGSAPRLELARRYFCDHFRQRVCKNHKAKYTI